MRKLTSIHKDIRGHSPRPVLLLLVVARDLDAMLRKTLAKGLRSSAARSFSSSAPARRVVATNPVKAQEVQVRVLSPQSPLSASCAVSDGFVGRRGGESIRSLNMNTMPS